MSGAAGAAAGAGTGTGSAAAGGASGAGASAAGASVANGATGGTGSAGGNVSNTGAPGANGAGATAGPDWMSSIENVELKGFAQNKGWKNPTELVDSYRNLEKLRGVPESQLLVIPKSDDATAMEAMYNRLGRPGNPDGYGLQTPKENGNVDFTKWAANQFHKLGLTDSQGKAMFEAFNSRANELRGQSTAAAQAKGVQEIQSLKSEWGAAYDQEVARGQRAAREFGVDMKMMTAIENAIGTQATMKFFNSIGKKVGDPGFIAGTPSNDPNGGPMTPAQANEQIKTLRSDPGFQKKYVEGDAVARSTMERLHRYAHPESA